MTDITSVAYARSLLFVPGDRPDRFDKALATGADGVIIDLEDAVAAEAKADALAHTAQWLSSGAAALVRINAMGTRTHDAEVEALGPTATTIVLPKAQDPEALAGLVARLGGQRLVALVETAIGVREAYALAAVPGVVRLALGNVDLSVELGVDPGSHAALAYTRGRLVAASAAAGIAPPVDGVTTALQDAEVLARDLAVSRELGFGGKLCIHPSQVAAVNDALLPAPEELAWAERVLEAAGSAETSGVAVVDGSMVDAPVVARAERVVARASRNFMDGKDTPTFGV